MKSKFSYFSALLFFVYVFGHRVALRDAYYLFRNSWDLVLALSLPPSTTSGLSVHLTTVDPKNPSDDDVQYIVEMNISSTNSI